MVDKLIRGKIIEIVVVLIFVIISIPLWDSFEKKISAAEVTTMEDYNMNFEVYNTNNKETKYEGRYKNKEKTKGKTRTNTNE